MTYEEILNVLANGSFYDDNMKWKIKDDDLDRLTEHQIIVVKTIAVKYKADFEKLAAEQLAAESKGKKYKLPPGVPEGSMSFQVEHYNRFFKKLSDNLSVAEKAFKAPQLANEWLPSMVSSTSYFDGKTHYPLDRICKAAYGMRAQIEVFILCLLESSNFKLLLNESDSCHSLSESCEPEFSDVENAMLYGFLTLKGYDWLVNNSPAVTGSLDNQWGQWIFKITSNLSTFPFQVALALMKCDGKQGTYTKALYDIELDITGGISHAAKDRVGSTPFARKAIDPGNAFYDWVRKSSTIEGSLYSYYKVYIDSFNRGGW